MQLTALLGTLTGGIGLFLLGMWLMTEGLKLAAGPALERILARSTGTRLRGLASGMLVTSIVQSSGAVTIAAIGFINAGLLTLGQALWVLFGANVGTTMTGWLVAAAGLGFRIEAAALPLIGIGMLLHLTGRGSRRGAIGMTMAGFGILFLGIDILKDGFIGVAGQIALPTAGGALAVATLVGVGALLTVLMQSSSASLAVALTAAQGGLLPLEAAAAMVIGANLGSTSTAIFAALGATANARRAAAAHVLFNLLTGAVALLLLPWLLQAIVALRDALDMTHAPATTLALFHTIFNVLGVLLMWPLAEPLTRFLARRFGAAKEDEARARYLDENAAAVPTLALAALEREIGRMEAIAQRMLRRALAGREEEKVLHDAEVAHRLKLMIGQFITRLNRSTMTSENAQRLSRLLRLLRYYDSVAELAQTMAASAREPAITGGSRALHEVRNYLAQVDAYCLPPAPDTSTETLEPTYQALKAALLEDGATGALGMSEMEALLRRCSLARRAAEQAIKAARTLAGLRNSSVASAEADEGSSQDTTPS